MGEDNMAEMNDIAESQIGESSQEAYADAQAWLIHNSEDHNEEVRQA
jgi:hypothetical protein